MKKGTTTWIPVLFSLISAFALVGCAVKANASEQAAATTETETETEAEAEETPTGSNAEEPAVTNCYLVTNMYGDGQKPWYIVLEYNKEVDPASLSAADYQVDDYDIKAVYVNTEAALPGESTTGSFVLVELSTDYTTANYGGGGSNGSDSFGGRPAGTINDSDATETESDHIRDDGSRGGRGSMSFQSSPSNQLSVTLRQTEVINFTDGSVLDAWGESLSTDYNSNVNLLVENFSQDTFSLSDGTTMMYSLYLPDDYYNNEDTEYPLVLFMPDATGEGSDEYLALTESLGGVIWTTEDWQSRHETIVLVPQYESSNTQNPADTMELLAEIVSRYRVDTSREYLVGQSSGTIRSIKLLLDYPDEFAGAFLVAGQADSAYIDRISGLATQNIWMVCSEGDARAYPGMTEITEAVEAAGTNVTIAQWSAALPDEEQEQLAAEQASAGTTINWTIFDRETVMRDDVASSDATEHMNTWRVSYDLDTICEWLFEQKK